jgi:hypothetical protein
MDFMTSGGVHPDFARFMEGCPLLSDSLHTCTLSVLSIYSISFPLSDIVHCVAS